MSDPSRVEMLEQLRQESTVLVARVRGREISLDALQSALTDRQNLVEAITSTDMPVTPRERVLATEVATLDRTLMRWCDAKQREIAQHLARNAPRGRATQSAPRIIRETA